MKKIIIIFLSLLVVLFASCEPNGYNGTDFSAYTLMQAQCPYTNSCFWYSESIEQDAYGRRLFKFWGGSNLAYESENATLYIYAILQKETDEWVWFYETDCYMMKPSLEAFTTEAVDELKARNDWNTEPDISKASKVNRVSKNNRHIPLSYSRDSIKNLISTICEPGANANYLAICNDKNGQTLVFIRTYTRNEEWETENYTAYAAILKADGTYSDDSLIEMDDFYNHTECLKILKARNQWTLSQ